MAKKQQTENIIRIVHDREGCIGCGACAVLCEKYWRMDNDGMASLIGGKKAGKNFERVVENIECNQEAADGCPVAVIHIKRA
ncbi:MAG: ferredoxin [Patescibacteria group bacterium]|jgi:ferredoxin